MARFSRTNANHISHASRPGGSFCPTIFDVKNESPEAARATGCLRRSIGKLEFEILAIAQEHAIGTRVKADEIPKDSATQ